MKLFKLCVFAGKFDVETRPMSSCLWRVILVEAVPDHGYEQIILLVVFACTSLLYLAFSSHLLCMFVLLLRRLPHMTRELCGLIYIYTHTKQPLPKFFFTFNAFTCVFLALCGFHEGVLTVRDIKCIGHWHFPWLAHTHKRKHAASSIRTNYTQMTTDETQHTNMKRKKTTHISNLSLSGVLWHAHYNTLDWVCSVHMHDIYIYNIGAQSNVSSLYQKCPFQTVAFHPATIQFMFNAKLMGAGIVRTQCSVIESFRNQ